MSAEKFGSFDNIRPVGGNVEDVNDVELRAEDENDERLINVLKSPARSVVEKYAAAKELEERGQLVISEEVCEENGRIEKFNISVRGKIAHVE